MNKLLPGVIRPVSDELLSSWICRGLRLNNDRRFDRLLSLYYDRKIFDPDHQDSNAAIEIISNIFEQPQRYFRSMLPAVNYWVTPLKHRNLYCSDCILSDIRKGQVPAYRKSWVYRWSIICPIHGTILETTGEIDIGTNKTIQLAVYTLAKNQLNSSTVKPTIRGCKYSAYIGYSSIAFYFQQWLSKQARCNQILMPSGQFVTANHFFNMLDTICASMMRPSRDDETHIPQTYSYLPPKKWPKELLDIDAAQLTYKEISSYDPIEKAGLLAHLGMLVGVSKCCYLWRLLARSSPHYSYPNSKSLFPNDDRNYRGRIVDALTKENNPLLETVIRWFDLDLRQHAGIIMPSIKLGRI